MQNKITKILIRKDSGSVSERGGMNMSLLWMEYESEFEHLVEASYERESKAKEEYFNSLSDRVKKIIYRDTRYNIDYLYTAYVLGDKRS